MTTHTHLKDDTQLHTNDGVAPTESITTILLHGNTNKPADFDHKALLKQ